MPNFYRYNVPFYNPYRRNFYYNNYPYSTNYNSQASNSTNATAKTSPQSNTNSSNIEQPYKNDNSRSLPPNKDFRLDLFGLTLYFDDILILSLLFFLYKEEVKDEGLFLALVMLLIS